MNYETDGQSLVENLDLTPGVENPPGQHQLGQGEATGQKEGEQHWPGRRHATT